MTQNFVTGIPEDRECHNLKNYEEKRKIMELQHEIPHPSVPPLQKAMEKVCRESKRQKLANDSNVDVELAPERRSAP